MALLVVPESVWVEKRFAAGGTHQPHSQVHLAYMCADGGMWGWWTLLEACNLALVYSFDAPQLNTNGLHIGGDGLLWSWRGSWRGRLHCLVCRIRDIRSCGLLGGGVDGRWWWMGCGRSSCEEVGLGIWRNVTLLPSKAHRNPLPLNLPLLLPSFPIPQSPSTTPPPPICGPPPSGNQPISVDPAPERWKIIQE